MGRTSGRLRLRAAVWRRRRTLLVRRRMRSWMCSRRKQRRKTPKGKRRTHKRAVLVVRLTWSSWPRTSTRTPSTCRSSAQRPKLTQTPTPFPSHGNNSTSSASEPCTRQGTGRARGRPSMSGSWRESLTTSKATFCCKKSARLLLPNPLSALHAPTPAQQPRHPGLVSTGRQCTSGRPPWPSSRSSASSPHSSAEDDRGSSSSSSSLEPSLTTSRRPRRPRWNAAQPL
mmetsp:Transcript_5632/g.15785  ORF Transcript_5632/g.15785 Transcript_5632/m.15785 type:complete len:228 (-) Transcript_5632:1215-1898(-)